MMSRFVSTVFAIGLALMIALTAAPVQADAPITKPTGVNLRVAKVGVPSTVWPGQKMSVLVDIANLAHATAHAGAPLDIYISPRASLDERAIHLTHVTLDQALVGQASNERAVDVTVPRDLNSGVFNAVKATSKRPGDSALRIYYILVRVEAASGDEEVDTSDNVGVTPIFVYTLRA